MKKAIWNAFLRVAPGGWRLPIHYWRCRITGYVEAEMSLIRWWKDEEKIAVDIGANQGTYSFELARWFRKVEAFEPNDRISSEIQAYDQSRITLHSVALSAAQGAATFHVPILMRTFLRRVYSALLALTARESDLGSEAMKSSSA